PLDRPQREIVWPVGAAAPELVVEHDLAAVAERLERGPVVVRHARGAVQAHERHAALADAAVPDAPARDVDHALGRLHAAVDTFTASSSPATPYRPAAGL